MAHEDLGFQEDSPHSDLGFVSDDDVSANRMAAGKAFVDHGGNAALLGYGPQVVGGLTHGLLQADDWMHGTNNADLVPYSQLRDDTINDLDQEKQNHPIASGAGTVTGAVASSVPMAAGLPVKAATWAGRALKAGAIGGAIGGLSNPGDTQGIVDPLQLEARAKNAAMSAPIGAATSIGADAISGVAGTLAGKFKDTATDKYLKAIGIGKADYERLRDKNMLDPLAQTARDEGAVGWFSGPKTISAKLSDAKDAAGEELGTILDQADSSKAPKISAKDLALELSEDPRIAQLSKTPGSEGTAKQVNSFLDTLYENGDDMSLREAQLLRRGIDRSINFNKIDPNMKGSQPFLKDMRDAIRDKMNDSVNALDQSQGGEAANRLLDANKRYSNLTTLNDMADDRVARMAANRAVGLTDTIAGGAGAGIGAHIGMSTAGPAGAKMGAAAGGAIGAIGNKIGRTIGPSFQAKSSDALASILQAFPKLAGAVQNNPAAQANLVSSLTRSNQPAPVNYQNAPISPALMDRYKQNPDLVDQITNAAWKAQVQKALGKAGDRNPADAPIKSLKQGQQQFIQGESD